MDDIYQQLADAGFCEKVTEHIMGQSGTCIECASLCNGCDLIPLAIEEYGHPSLVWGAGCEQWKLHPDLNNIRQEWPK